MKKSSRLILVIVLVLMNGCSSMGANLDSSGTIETTVVLPAVRTVEATLVQETAAPAAPSLAPLIPDGALLDEFDISSVESFSLVRPPDYKAVGKTTLGPTLPVNPGGVLNIEVSAGLLDEEKARLWQDGFVVVETNEDQFGEVRTRVSEIYGQPYFLTTDAAFHALHLTFDELLKAMEKEQFYPLMKQITAETLETVKKYKKLAGGSSLSGDVDLAEAYLSVGLKLFDPQASLDPQVEGRIRSQMDQIQAESGRDKSALIPGFEDDYSAYRPVGHYAGDQALENYFRGMTWFGRVQFQLASKDPNFKPSRAPLIITLAMRQKGEDGGSPAQKWGGMHDALTFMIGPVDDGSPLEYAALMDRIYGKGHGLEDLKNEDLWRQFVASRSALPAPQINSTFSVSLKEMPAEHGWRFSGQRFTLDAFFLQNLVYDYVGTLEKPRKLPSGLDVMAVLGSQPAQNALEKMGATGYAHYSDQQAGLQAWVGSLPQENWWKTFQSTWLFAFLAVVQLKGDAFPPYMRTDAWGYKDLNSALGSWAELKHDTSLYAKMPEFGGGGGPPASGAAPAFVEPNPEAFYRMAFAIQNLADGLTLRGMNSSLEPSQPGDFSYPGGVDGLLTRSAAFGERLFALGDIAKRELAGEPLNADDFDVIQRCLGLVECQVEFQNLMAGGPAGKQQMPPVPMVAAAAGAENNLLEVGVGKLNRIFVVVPLEGGLEIAQGNVFSYYEFVQPRSGRLTDQVWQEELATGKHSLPEWAAIYLSQAGGEPVDALVFRIDDWYILTPAGDDLNVRQEPGKGGEVVGKLYSGDYIQIVDGPKIVESGHWWKVRQDAIRDPVIEGWVIEDADWYERAHGQ